MALNVIRQVTTSCRHSLFNKSLRFYGIYEPPYLKVKEPEIPLYPVLNIQIRGYVYPLLESYQSFIHKVANVLDVDVEDSFGFPHQEYKVKRFKKESAVVDTEYHLRLYERDIQVSNVTSTKCPILIRILEATLPEGVSLHIDTLDPMLDKRRYIPDKELLDLKSELSSMKKQ